MAVLTRDQVKNIVVKSLESVADLPANVEAATFAQFVDMDKHTFLSTLTTNLNEEPYHTNDGGTSDQAYYDADLTDDSIGQWATVGGCIDWIRDHQKTVYKNPQP